jgi:hypothetical protein
MAQTGAYTAADVDAAPATTGQYTAADLDSDQPPSLYEKVSKTLSNLWDSTPAGQVSQMAGHIANWASSKAEQNRQENLAAAANGQPAPHSEITNTGLGMLGSTGKMAQGATTPQGVGTAVGAVVAPEIVGPALIAHGGYKAATNAKKALSGDPDAQEAALGGLAEATGGGALTGSAVAGGLGNTVTGRAVGAATDLTKNTFIGPASATPKPVSPQVDVATPFDDAIIRKSLGGKDLSPAAGDVLKNAAGDTIQPGSSPENHLMKAVAPINDTIKTQGAALDNVIKNAGPLKTNPSSEITTAIKDLKDNLPGGTEEQFGKTIDKEIVRYQDAMGYTDPAAINNVIRDLDKRINSFRAPEEPINTPADAQDAARVTLRRVLRNKLDTEIPATAPINAELSSNIEARNLLQKKFGAIAFDPAAADAQHASELAKGQTILKNQDLVDKATRNRRIAEFAGAAAAGAPVIYQGVKALLGR